ncbi:MAG: hypothetical protein U5L72_04655 [Bacteroidales bacterium]|nr:hypothetical protein [Bacteroidales bacterium]
MSDFSDGSSCLQGYHRTTLRRIHCGNTINVTQSYHRQMTLQPDSQQPCAAVTVECMGDVPAPI